MFKILITSFFLLLFSHASLAAEPLIVGVMTQEDPISYFRGGKAEGIAVDIFKAVAKKSNVSYQFVPLHSEREGYEMLMANKLDAALGIFTLNSLHFGDVFYSSPYFINTVGVVVPDSHVSFSRAIKEIGNPLFVGTFIWALFFLLLFTFILWLIEHKAHPQLRQLNFVAGLGYAMWDILSSFLRDLVYEPATTAGRVVMSLWLMCSVIFMTVLASIVTATIINISSFDNQKINHESDLHGKRIVTLATEHLEQFGPKFGSSLMQAKTEKEALDMLVSGEADVLIEDKAIAEQYLKTHADLPVHLANLTLKKDLFVFVFNKKYSEAATVFNRTLLDFQDTGGSQNVCARYLYSGLIDCAL